MIAKITRMLPQEQRADGIKLGLGERHSGQPIYVILEVGEAPGPVTALQGIMTREEAITVATELLRLAGEIRGAS